MLVLMTAVSMLGLTVLRIECASRTADSAVAALRVLAKHIGMVGVAKYPPPCSIAEVGYGYALLGDKGKAQTTTAFPDVETLWYSGFYQAGSKDRLAGDPRPLVSAAAMAYMCFGEVFSCVSELQCRYHVSDWKAAHIQPTA